MLTTSLALLGLIALGPADPEDSTRAALSPRLRSDIVLVGAVTIGWAALNPDVRSGILERGSFGHVVANFRSPIRRAIEGAREDDDSFATNYVSHPVSWALLGLYLRERGYSRRTALLLTQVHSVAWEYVIEGSYQKPSGNDLLANAAGAIVAIYWPRADKSLHARMLALLNPFRPPRSLVTGGHGATVSVGPVPRGDRLTLGLIFSR